MFTTAVCHSFYLLSLLELAGGTAADTPGGAGAPPLPGRSLVPAFRRDGAVEREFLFFYHGGNRALREGNWKLVSARDDNDVWELYDLAADRSELVDLSGKHPERAERMKAKWEELEAKFRGQAGVP